MYSGVVPQDWRIANVTPIFKKGSKGKPENHRPVSLTSIGPARLWNRSYDDGEAMDVVYLDFRKAFDKVSKMRLIEKIKSHSVDGRLLSWILHWLSNRKQRTVWNVFSQSGVVLPGVPQGSCWDH